MDEGKGNFVQASALFGALFTRVRRRSSEVRIALVLYTRASTI